MPQSVADGGGIRQPSPCWRACSSKIMRPIQAAFGLMSDGTAVVEMAAASGLVLVAPEERDPLTATTYGTGELIAPLSIMARAKSSWAWAAARRWTREPVRCRLWAHGCSRATAAIFLLAAARSRVLTASTSCELTRACV